MTARPTFAPAAPAPALACWLLLAGAAAALPASPVAPVAPASSDADTAAGVPAKRSALALEASSWVFPSRPLKVTLEQGGVLAGRRLAIDLFVDQNQWQRVTTKADRTPVRLDLPPLSAGRHVLMAKAGREAARTEFRVIPWSWLAGAIGAIGGLALAGTGLVVALRRRPHRRATPGVRSP